MPSTKRRWGGGEAAWNRTVEMLSDFHKRVEDKGECLLTISVLEAVDPASAKEEFDTLYPINSLRNVAVRNAHSPLIMVVDADFAPSEGFHEFLTSDPVIYASLLHHASASRRVWALVSLELHAGHLPIPSTRAEVAALLPNRSVVVAEAYLNPAAHEPVDIDHWLRADGFADGGGAPLTEDAAFEPFVLGAREALPDYDERFRGYGFDKTAHARHLRSLGFSYWLLPRHFAVARYHHPTPTAVRMFGEDPDMLLRTRMEWLFDQVSSDIDAEGGGYQPLTAASTSRRGAAGAPPSGGEPGP